MIYDSSGDPIQKKKKAPNALKRWWNTFNKWLIALGALIGLLAGIFGNLDNIKSLFIEKKGDVELSKVVVDSYREDYSCLLDFRIINKGDRTTVIDKIILECYFIRTDMVFGPLKTSASYGLDISDIEKVCDKVELVVSYQIKPDEADRFTVKLVANEKPVYGRFGFHIFFETSDGLIKMGSVPKVDSVHNNQSPNAIVLPYNRFLGPDPKLIQKDSL